MADEESVPPSSLEDPSVPAQDSDVPDPTGAREDPETQGAIYDATQSAKDDIANALADPTGGEDEQPEQAPEGAAEQAQEG